jgi:hypothetical protein
MCKWQVLNDYNILYGMICFWTETGEALLSIAKRKASRASGRKCSQKA